MNCSTEEREHAETIKKNTDTTETDREKKEKGDRERKRVNNREEERSRCLSGINQQRMSEKRRISAGRITGRRRRQTEP